MLGWGSFREHGEVTATAHSELITCRWQPHYLQPSTKQRIPHVWKGILWFRCFQMIWQSVCCQCYNQLGGGGGVFQFNYEKLPWSSVKIFASHTNQGFNLYLGDSNELRVMIMEREMVANSLTFYILWLLFFFSWRPFQFFFLSLKFSFQFSGGHPAVTSQIAPDSIANHMGLHVQEGTLTPEIRHNTSSVDIQTCLISLER